MCSYCKNCISRCRQWEVNGLLISRGQHTYNPTYFIPFGKNLLAHVRMHFWYLPLVFFVSESRSICNWSGFFSWPRSLWCTALKIARNSKYYSLVSCRDRLFQSVSAPVHVHTNEDRIKVYNQAVKMESLTIAEEQ